MDGQLYTVKEKGYYTVIELVTGSMILLFISPIFIDFFRIKQTVKLTLKVIKRIYEHVFISFD